MFMLFLQFCFVPTFTLLTIRLSICCISFQTKIHILGLLFRTLCNGRFGWASCFHYPDFAYFCLHESSFYTRPRLRFGLTYVEFRNAYLVYILVMVVHIDESWQLFLPF